MTLTPEQERWTRPVERKVCHANGCHFLRGKECNCGLRRLDKLFLAARDVRDHLARNQNLDPWLANLVTAVAAIERANP